MAKQPQMNVDLNNTESVEHKNGKIFSSERLSALS